MDGYLYVIRDLKDFAQCCPECCRILAEPGNLWCGLSVKEKLALKFLVLPSLFINSDPIWAKVVIRIFCTNIDTFPHLCQEHDQVYWPRYFVICVGSLWCP